MGFAADNNTSNGVILAVDDNDEALFALVVLLQDAGYVVHQANSGRQALDVLNKIRPDLILSDVSMADLDGLELTRVVKSDLDLRYVPVVLLTANDELPDIIRGFEAGADDYIKKPYNKQELLARLAVLQRLRRLYLDLRQATDLNANLEQRLAETSGHGEIKGESQALRQVFAIINKVKDSEAPVLIWGESGTGKELIARALHFQSRRADKPFIAQNCAAFNDNLLESELFGHVKGSFTGALRDKRGVFEIADGGTLFLDEIGEMSLSFQAKLLRVLQDGRFQPVGGLELRQANVRVVGATHRDLRKLISEGKFREDLYYRLNVISLEVPALRERKADIPILANYFLSLSAKRNGGVLTSQIPSAVMEALVNYDWPGNIRELQNEMERFWLMSEGRLELEFLSRHIGATSSDSVEHVEIASESENGGLKSALETLERRLISEALLKAEGNKSEAARTLGISRSTLLQKLSSYGL